MLAAVSHRFQNYSEGLNSCMCVTSEGEGEKQKRRRNEQFVTFDGSKFANNNKRQMEDKKSAYF